MLIAADATALRSGPGHDMGRSYRTHDGGLPVKLLGVSCTLVIVRKVEIHTRSSPCGPAEHDEGGSLQDIASVVNMNMTCSTVVCVSASSVRFIPLAQVHSSSYHIPAKICKLLVDSFKSHCDVCVGMCRIE
jgi:hypothetical protein